ncbi:MAG: cytidine deaminase [Elusimicrobia bacterium]|nr:cytidine deaminase [Elusimicrobiota bacterium]
MKNIYKKLVDAAKNAMKKSYSPYSRFRVGAALMINENKIYTGTNIENASYGLAICAERVAIFKALSEGEKKFKAIAVIPDSKDFCYPCGACLQVMSEFNKDIDIILGNNRAKFKMIKLPQLLPNSFKLNKRKNN